MVLHFSSQSRCFVHELFPFFHRSSKGLLLLLFGFPPFLSDFLASVLTFRAANLSPLITSIAAYLVVANAIIDPLEWDIERLVSFVFAVKVNRMIGVPLNTVALFTVGDLLPVTAMSPFFTTGTTVKDGIIDEALTNISVFSSYLRRTSFGQLAV